ncbi:hypothetical protein EV144_103302 [Flavobacterium sp. 270]|uniref:hypothetical protein n=1 Tax=Flavobacterium sp. 270 TaxID=2512114 RepID=UPI0010656BBC|nr:hypothetical protein [Flavobacterium sp. 270]TDW48785.1 hypothetical protein EV144_103302 [Flavobacterium sp. 270]
MSQKSYVKCLECNTVNVNSDYCSNCGAIINVVLKRKLETEKKIQKKVEENKTKEPNKIEVFLRKASEHPNAFIRLSSQAIFAVWLFMAMVVGGLIAAVVAIAAG